MIQIRRAAERGHFNHGWLDTYHTFSFGDYRDPAHMGLRSLRVINDDIVQPGAGFGMHPHRDMEIITYVVSGAIAHRDSLDNGETLAAGSFQVMTAGSGIVHAEFNPSSDAPVRIIQTWIRPSARGLTPSYQDRPADQAGPAGQWDLVAAGGAISSLPNGSAAHTAAVLPIQQDAWVYHAVTPRAATLVHALARARAAWIQVVEGDVEVEGHTLHRGDGAAIENVEQITLRCSDGADILLYDLGE